MKITLVLTIINFCLLLFLSIYHLVILTFGLEIYADLLELFKEFEPFLNQFRE